MRNSWFRKTDDAALILKTRRATERRLNAAILRLGSAASQSKSCSLLVLNEVQSTNPGHQ